MAPPPPARARWALVACALVAACALLFSVESLAWWRFTEAQVFLTRSRRCFGGECQGADLTWLGASAWWQRFAAAAFGVGLFAALLAVFVAGARAAGRLPRTAARSLLVAVGTGVVCGAGALLTFPPLDHPRLGWGPLVFAVGLGFAVASAWMVRRGEPVA
jgi:hypothetical protein